MCFVNKDVETILRCVLLIKMWRPYWDVFC